MDARLAPHPAPPVARGSRHPGAACRDGGGHKTRSEGKETTCTGGENNQAEGKGKKNNLSSYNIKALLPSKEIKARVK